MGIKTETVTTATCDHCDVSIDEDRFVDASTYGVAFHVECWISIGGPRVARLLYLDEIRYTDEFRTCAWGPGGSQ
jgi:hypothetical protein